MPAKTSRRQLLERLALVPMVAVLGTAALAPAFLRVESGQRFTIVHEREDLPKQQREAELDWAAERMTKSLELVCFASTSVHRIGDRIMFGVDHENEENNRRLAERMIAVAEPVQLRITSVTHGIIDVDLERERLPFY